MKLALLCKSKSRFTFQVNTASSSICNGRVLDSLPVEHGQAQRFGLVRLEVAKLLEADHAILVDDYHLRRPARVVTRHRFRNAPLPAMTVHAYSNRDPLFAYIVLQPFYRLIVVTFKDSVNFDELQASLINISGKLLLPVLHEWPGEFVATWTPELEEINDDDLAAQLIYIAAVTIDPL